MENIKIILSKEEQEIIKSIIYFGSNFINNINSISPTRIFYNEVLQYGQSVIKNLSY